jgi:hypothetical protein
MICGANFIYYKPATSSHVKPGHSEVASLTWPLLDFRTSHPQLPNFEDLNPPVRRSEIPDLCRFMTPELRRFMILDLRGFMIPALHRFMASDLRRFMIPALHVTPQIFN